MLTVDRKTTHPFDSSLAVRADRKLRRFGSSLDDLLLIVVTSRTKPDFICRDEVPVPLDAHDSRIERALSSAEVTVNADGTFSAVCRMKDGLEANGKTRKAALAELREELRYLIGKPVKMRYSVRGRRFAADVRPCRTGGFWAIVPSIGGVSTYGDTMDQTRDMLIDLTKGCIGVE